MSREIIGKTTRTAIGPNGTEEAIYEATRTDGVFAGATFEVTESELTAAERIRQAREQRGDADPLNRLRAHNAAAIAAGAEPITEEPADPDVRAYVADGYTVIAATADGVTRYAPDDDSAGTPDHNRAADLTDAEACDALDAAIEEQTGRHPADPEPDDDPRLLAAIADLEALAGAAIHALTREETRLASKVQRLEAITRPKYPSTHALELADARAGLEATTGALAIARNHDPHRRAILAKLNDAG